MTVSKSPEEEPEVTVVLWAFGQSDLGIHLVGFHAETRQGRMSSPLVGLDLRAGLAWTSSGRVYHLRGQCSLEAGAMVLRTYMRERGLPLSSMALVDPEEAALWVGNVEGGAGAVGAN